MIESIGKETPSSIYARIDRRRSLTLYFCGVNASVTVPSGVLRYAGVDAFYKILRVFLLSNLLLTY